MRHIFEEEFRLENPQWDFDNNILEPYTRWLEIKLLEERKQLALYNGVERSEQLVCSFCGTEDGKHGWTDNGEICPLDRTA